MYAYVSLSVAPLSGRPSSSLCQRPPFLGSVRQVSSSTFCSPHPLLRVHHRPSPLPPIFTRQCTRCDSSESSIVVDQHASTATDWKNDICPGAVVEIWSNGRLRFALVDSLYEKGVLASLVEVSSTDNTLADPVKISTGEIISIWSSSLFTELPSSQLPRDIFNALQFLEKVPSRSLDITKAYNQMRRLPKSDSRALLSSEQIAEIVFPLRPSDTRDFRATVTAATAILVATDVIRFKRAPPGLGWRALPSSVAVTRGRCSFVSACSSILSARRSNELLQPPVWSREQLDILRDLEIVAASGSNAHGTAATALQDLGYEATDAGAAALLLDIRYWATGTHSKRGSAQRREPIITQVHPHKSTDGRNTSGNSSEGKSVSSNTERVNISSRNIPGKEWTFSPEILEEARELRVLSRERKSALLNQGKSSTEKRRRNLFRPKNGEPALKTYCVDEKSSRFLDDAISVEVLGDGSVIRLFVHIADVDEIVRSGSPIDELAKERGQSLYLPLRPLHMLPGAVMEAASFNTTFPTEAISIMVDFNVDDDNILNWEVFASIVPPVKRINYEQFDAALERGAEAANITEDVCRDLERLTFVSSLLAEKLDRRTTNRKLKAARMRSEAANPTNASDYASRSIASVRLVKRGERGSKKASKVAHVVDFQSTTSHVTINEVLTSTGGLIRQFAKENRVHLPEARLAAAFVARCGTAPLRRYADLATQRQIKCILFGRVPAGRRRMDDLRIWLAKKQSDGEKTVLERRRAALYDSFSSHCAQICAATGVTQAVVPGRVRNVMMSKKGVLRIDVAINGTGLLATASVSKKLSSSILKLSRSEGINPSSTTQDESSSGTGEGAIDTGTETDDGVGNSNSDKHHLLLQKARKVLAPGTGVRVQIAQVNIVSYKVVGCVVELSL